jgi:hypothetical protein
MTFLARTYSNPNKTESCHGYSTVWRHHGPMFYWTAFKGWSPKCSLGMSISTRKCLVILHQSVNWTGQYLRPDTFTNDTTFSFVTGDESRVLRVCVRRQEGREAVLLTQILHPVCLFDSVINYSLNLFYVIFICDWNGGHAVLYKWSTPEWMYYDREWTSYNIIISLYLFCKTCVTVPADVQLPLFRES